MDSESDVATDIKTHLIIGKNFRRLELTAFRLKDKCAVNCATEVSQDRIRIYCYKYTVSYVNT